MSKLIIYGTGGQAKVILDAALKSRIEIFGFVDNLTDSSLFKDYPVFKNAQNGHRHIIAIGNNKIRKKIVEQCNSLTQFSQVIIHPTATVNSIKSIGDGTVVLSNAIINPDAVIGSHCIINTAAVIEHDCMIKDYVHISPGAVLSGNVTIGTGTHIGSGAVVIPGIKIGAWCTIGAGTVVIKDIPDGSTVVGNPGRLLTK